MPLEIPKGGEFMEEGDGSGGLHGLGWQGQPGRRKAPFMLTGLLGKKVLLFLRVYMDQAEGISLVCVKYPFTMTRLG